MFKRIYEFDLMTFLEHCHKQNALVTRDNAG